MKHTTNKENKVTTQAQTQEQATQPQNTSKGVEDMKEKNAQTPKAQGKDKPKNKSNKPQAKPQAQSKATANKKDKKTFYVDGTKCNLVFPTLQTTPDVKNGELVHVNNITLASKEVDLSKVVKAGQELTFAKFVQSRILDMIKDKANEERARIEAKKVKAKRSYTEQETTRRKGLDQLKKACEQVRAAYTLPSVTENTHALVTLLACYYTGANIPYDISGTRKALEQMNTALDRFNIDGLANGKAEYTTEEQAIITQAKADIKTDFEKFCTASDLCTGFKLGVSNKDLLNFYKMSRMVNKSTLKESFIWELDKNGQTSAVLHRQLVTWALVKMKLEDKEELSK